MSSCYAAILDFRWYNWTDLPLRALGKVAGGSSDGYDGGYVGCRPTLPERLLKVPSCQLDTEVHLKDLHLRWILETVTF